MLPENATSERPVARHDSLVGRFASARGDEMENTGTMSGGTLPTIEMEELGVVWETLLEMERFDYRAAEDREAIILVL